MEECADARKTEEVMREAWIKNLGGIAAGLVSKASAGNYQAVLLLYKLAGYGVKDGELAKQARHAPRMFLLELMQTILSEEKPVAPSAPEAVTQPEPPETDREAAEVTDDAEGDAC